jgi:type II secretory pathway component PulJ
MTMRARGYLLLEGLVASTLVLTAVAFAASFFGQAFHEQTTTDQHRVAQQELQRLSAQLATAQGLPMSGERSATRGVTLTWHVDTTDTDLPTAHLTAHFVHNGHTTDVQRTVMMRRPEP